MIETPNMDDLERTVCGLANDRVLTLTVGQVRELLEEARGAEAAARDGWMEADEL